MKDISEKPNEGQELVPSRVEQRHRDLEAHVKLGKEPDEAIETHYPERTQSLLPRIITEG